MAENTRTSVEEPALKWRPWQKVTLIVAFFLLLVSFFFGPFTYLYETHQSNVQQHENAQALAHIQNSEAGIRQLLNFVASVQKPDSTNAIEQQWYVAELEAICAKVHCANPALETLLPPTPPTTAPKN